MKFITMFLVVAILSGCSESKSEGKDLVKRPGTPNPVETPDVITPPNPIGTVTVTASNYTCNGTNKCYDLTVACPGVANTARVVLYVVEPTGTDKGTITFHSGSGGKGFYASETNSQGILSGVKAAGFRTVQVKWKDAWLEGTEGLQKLACRPATTIQWVKDNLSQGKAMCSTGNSGGSVQTATSLIWYNAALDMLLPSAGPGMGDIMTGCLVSTSPLYLHDQQSIFDSTYGAPACSSKDLTYTSRFEEDSLALGAWNYNFPNTYIHMIGGLSDGLATNAQSQLVYDRLVSSGSPMLARDILSGVGHSVQQDPVGANAIKTSLIANCKVQGGPPPVEPVFDVLCPGVLGAGPYFNLNGKTKINKLTNVVLVGHTNVKAKFYSSSSVLTAVIYDITHKCTDLNTILPADDYSAEFFDMDTGETPIPVSVEDSTFKVK